MGISEKCPIGVGISIEDKAGRIDVLHEDHKYSAERAKKYLSRLKQLTADDVSLWANKVDEFGGTDLDAAVNIVLLDGFFEKEMFQRDKFKAAVDPAKK